jgi:hypothetical protein
VPNWRIELANVEKADNNWQARRHLMRSEPIRLFCLIVIGVLTFGRDGVPILSAAPPNLVAKSKTISPAELKRTMAKIPGPNGIVYRR